MYAKIFSQILESSLTEDVVTRHVFMDLLLLCDQQGVLDMTFQAIARRTLNQEDVIRAAIAKLMLPDEESRTAKHEGRRLIPLDDHRSWGWQIVNYRKYADTRDAESKREHNKNYYQNITKPKRSAKQQKTNMSAAESLNSEKSAPHTHTHTQKNLSAARAAGLLISAESQNQPLDENLPFDTLDQLPETDSITKPCSAGQRTNGTAHHAVLVAVAGSIHARHPSAHGRRDCSVAVVEKQLEAILKHKHIPSCERESYLRCVDANHASMCASEQWTKNGGEFAKSLSNWLAPTKERYDVNPAVNDPGDSPRRLMA